MIDNSALLSAVLRNDLSSFIHKVFTSINPGAEYESNWHIDLLAEYLNEVQSGRIKRLIINIPPRTLKSVCISVAWPAWLLGHDPKTRILAASYSQILSNKLSLDSRFILASEWYKKLFPKTRIHSKQNTKNKFLTTKYGFRFATSVGGSITGEGGDYLILDDPHNPTMMFSEKYRNKGCDWFSQTFSTRLNNRSDGRIVMVMQRLHPDDLTGFLENNSDDEWEILKIPVIANSKLTFSRGNVSHIMEKDESLNNVLFSDESIKKLVAEIGESNFAAQYLQSPLLESAGVLRQELLIFYESAPAKFDMIIQSWDTAIKIYMNSDFSACTTWGIIGNKYYLLSVIQDKYEYPHLKKEVIALNAKYQPDIILIEDKASGQSLIQDLNNDGFRNIIPIMPVQDKVTRFATCIDLFEAGRVMIPNNQLGNEDKNITKLIYQLLKFPNAKNDDLVDSISQFLNYIKTRKTRKARIRDL